MVLMKKFLRLFGPIAVVSILIIVGWMLVANAHFVVLDPVGFVGSQQKKLLIFACILSALVVIPVFIMLFVISWKFREGNQKAAYDPEWGHNNRLELLWWGIPITIIVVLSIITWKTSHELDPYHTIESKNKTIDVQVVALQWKWLFIYPEYGTASINELAMPVDHPVRFRLTADAPMSAFWVPQLGSQIYSMNGMASQINLVANKTGTFEGYNTNINGPGYSSMTFQVKAMSTSDFATWTKQGSESAKTLDDKTFKDLIKPGVQKQPVQYKLADKDMFDMIVMKYMHGETSQRSGENSPKKSEKSSNDHDDTKGMDMHDMKGMHHE